MYHSITFGEKNTWDDWHLIPSSRPVFNPPDVKSNYVEIPGGDGILDLTSALAGRPTYKNRIGSFNFYVENGFLDWTILFSEIMAYLHGQKMRAILEDDPEYYYEGRFEVDKWNSDKSRSLIVLSYDVDPYKYKIDTSTKDWLWDPFNFETGVIRYYKDLPVKGTLEIAVIGDVMPSCPIIITSTSGMSVEFKGTRYSLNKGKNVVQNIILQHGENLMTFYGNGTVTISNSEEGRL